MHELLELLLTPAGIAKFITAFLALIFLWFRLKESTLRISQRRQQGLRKLLEKKTALSVPPLLLQMDLQQTVEMAMDEREFAFIQSRHSPLSLLNKRKSAAHFARFKDTSDGYEDARSKWARKIVSLQASSWIFLIGSSLALPFLIIFVMWAWSVHPIPGVFAIVEAAWLVWGSAHLSIKLAAAHQLLSLDKSHPALSKDWKKCAMKVGKNSAPRKSPAGQHIKGSDGRGDGAKSPSVVPLPDRDLHLQTK